ncbi:MAG: hypothetical protein ACXADA_10090 [Candidatus Hodarchaeales archaeon]|jgi:hypothetical protein
MRYLSFVPPLTINGSIEVETSSSLIKKVKVTSSFIELDLVDEFYEESRKNNENISKTLRILTLNSQEQVHQRIDIDVVPLELLYFTSIEFVDDLGIMLDSYILLYPDKPKNGFFNLFFTDSIAGLIQVPDSGFRYSRTHLLTPFKNLLLSLKVYSDPYEEYIENAIGSFQENILKPARTTIDEIMKRSKDIPVDEIETNSVKIQRADLLTLINQTSNLVTILNNEIILLKEKDRIHSHLIDSINAHTKLLSMLSEHINLEFEFDKMSFKCKIIQPMVVEPQKIADFFVKKIKQLE